MMTTLPLPRRTLILAACLAVAPALASCAQSVSPTAAPSPTTASSTASSTAPSAAPARSTTSSAAPSSSGQRIDITVTGRRVTPAPATVNLAIGQSMTITITSDRDNTLHAHGFEIERAVKAGQRVEVTVRGAQSGSYEVELHDPALRLLQVAVR